MYQHLYSDVIKNSVALFIIELVTKTIKQPESNAELYYFIEQYLIVLDEAEPGVMANLPLHFALQLAAWLGFGIAEKEGDEQSILDVQEGKFTAEIPAHGNYLEGRLADATAELVHIQNAVSLFRIKLNQQQRRLLMKAYEQVLFIPHYRLRFTKNITCIGSGIMRVPINPKPSQLLQRNCLCWRRLKRRM